MGILFTSLFTFHFLLSTFYNHRLSIAGGPDFQGIATWIFDVYLNQRLTGASPNAAWQITENAIRATDEWRSKH